MEFRIQLQLYVSMYEYLSRSSQLQIYRTVVRPVVTYGSESRTLTVEEERVLTVFERKILRKLYLYQWKKTNYGEFDEMMN
jgi:hypothetical protein